MVSQVDGSAPSGLCAVCRRRLPLDGWTLRRQYCGPSCRTIAWRRRRARRLAAEYPPDPLAQRAWEAERRLLADQATDILEALADRIPEQPASAGSLRELILAVAEEIRAAFHPQLADERGEES